MGLCFRAAASCVHPSVVHAEDHTVPEALATCHCALERDWERGDSQEKPSLLHFPPTIIYIRTPVYMRTPDGFVPLLTSHGIFFSLAIWGEASWKLNHCKYLMLGLICHQSWSTHCVKSQIKHQNKERRTRVCSNLVPNTVFLVSLLMTTMSKAMGNAHSHISNNRF